MNGILIAIFAILGLLIGSFLNVLILRYNTGKGFGGRSECFSCARTLGSRDLFPVLSYLFSGGRCRGCKSRISKQYVMVELATALFFVFVYVHNRYLLIDGTGIFIIKAAIDCILMSLLIFMAGYDIRHKIIPDLAVFKFAGLALVGSLIISGFSWWLIAAGPLLALPFYLIWLLSGGRWMGLGDAKLALGFGWMLGLSLGGTAIIFGFWVGAAYAILVMLMRPNVILRNKIVFLICISLIMFFESAFGVLHISGIIMISVVAALIILVALSRTVFLKKMTLWGYLPALQMKSEVPFAPFLITGLLIVYVLGYNLFIFT
jgi:leader peptidase (prepilin peptidase)/N-methyltransferase